MSNPNELTREQIEIIQSKWGEALGVDREVILSLCDLALRALQDQKHHPMSSQDNPSSGGVEGDRSELIEALRVASEWARQVADRPDVPGGIRKAATGLRARYDALLQRPSTSPKN